MFNFELVFSITLLLDDSIGFVLVYLIASRWLRSKVEGLSIFGAVLKVVGEGKLWVRRERRRSAYLEVPASGLEKAVGLVLGGARDHDKVIYKFLL